MDTCDQVFNPSLNQQRYEFVVKLINETESRVVTDVGCSECNFIEKVKFLCPKVNEINGLDIDQSTLEFNLHKTKPLVCDSLFPRDERLETRVFKGSIEKFDNRIANCDLLSAIEVIEHLYPEQIPDFTSTIFGHIKPKIAVITTPNKEFNVVFRNGLHATKFRHPDHKFEWTRSQFEHYCKSVASKYDYTYEITGVGCASNTRKFIHVGFCTQIAVFTRRHTNVITTGCDNDKIIGDSLLFNYQLLSWEYFHTKDEQANFDLTTKIDLIENLYDNRPTELSCRANGHSTSCAHFFNSNHKMLNPHFPHIQIFIDFIRYHTLSQIISHDNNPNCCFIFRKKPTPIVLTVGCDNSLEEDEEEGSSSSSFGDSPVHFTVMNNPNNSADEYWD